MRGLGLYQTPCGILTTNKYCEHHDWITVDWETGARKNWGENYDGATRHGLTTKAYLTLELR
jgi:hypothetical protein